MTDYIGLVNTEIETELLQPIWLGAIYAKSESELSWLIGLSVIYEKNQTRQRHHRLYKYDLHQKWY